LSLLFLLRFFVFFLGLKDLRARVSVLNAIFVLTKRMRVRL
jgi:hypothetical protein